MTLNFFRVLHPKKQNRRETKKVGHPSVRKDGPGLEMSKFNFSMKISQQKIFISAYWV
jgi:hypothetical protein